VACNRFTETSLAGLYAAGECSSVGIHGANRLGSNSLAEIVVFGKVAGERAAAFARDQPPPAVPLRQAEASAARLLAMLGREQGDRVATLRDELGDCMEAGVGIFRDETGMRAACDKIAALRERWRAGIRLDDRSRVFNTEWLSAIELGFMLEVAEAMAHAALQRRESRGAHVRLDAYSTRDDTHYLKHSLAFQGGDGAPQIRQAPVVITRSAPQTRHYGGAGDKAVLT
jgi:fumarate reductase flavoprotein subunit